ncbi:type II toxin-antitoxin system Phd/YefM family antitoxin [Sphingomonas rubra]|uniref:Antitoxin n=1 Tax=Sphingomonas rubra TaxID=634430 RepID=A0A1I5U2D2_9SPHN|nr:type II toxin-antitoxin system Phd/YefM family antitoxin [Sphingomonas rubra]SFP89007.1 prevent-host-death family protein [Sphingomonas rubra]
MRFSTQIKPISYVKANAAEIIAELNDGGPPIVITQNGEATAVLQGVAEYERTQETLALLKILALGKREIAEGKTRPAREVLEELRDRIAKGETGSR